MIRQCFVICILIVRGYAELSQVVTDSVIKSAEIYYQLRFATESVPEDAKFEVPLEELGYLGGLHNIKVVIHGMKQSRDYVRATIANSYMSKRYAHVLLVDWSNGASLKLNQACSIVDDLAEIFAAKLQQFIRKYNINTSEFHLIGSGLGANIAGAIGELFSGRLGRITGLNPTTQIFPVQQLTHRAAQFVDIIHTACGEESDCTARGTADFYPNFPTSPQPGCEKDPYTRKCDEKRATIYFAESILRPNSFPVYSCDSQFLVYDASTIYNDCAAATANYTDRSGKKDPIPVYMGEKVRTNINGIFYVITNSRPPFGRAPRLR